MSIHHFLFFAIVNICLLSFLLTSYLYGNGFLYSFDPITTLFLILFFSAMVVGYASFLIVTSLFIPYVLSKYFKYKWPFIIFSVVLCWILFSILLLDRFVYGQFHFHIYGMLASMIFSKQMLQVYELSRSEYITISFLLFGILFLEGLLAFFSFQKKRICTNKTISYFLIGSFFLSFVVFLFAISEDTHDVQHLKRNHQIFSWGQLLPYYLETTSILLMNQYQPSEIATKWASFYYQLPHESHPLQYPTQGLQCSPPKKLPNIVFIVIDTFRFDSITENTMPFLNQFSRQSTLFKNHWSGGNSTLAGLFSLFYSIPSTYFESALSQQIGPVLFATLKHLSYDIKIFSGSEIVNPPLHKSVFLTFQNSVDTHLGQSPDENDKHVTEQFKKFLETAQKPFFSYLLFDSAHSYCTAKIPEFPYKPIVQSCSRLWLKDNNQVPPYLNRYKNALHFVDSQIQEVIAALEKKQLLNNTILVITGDHGEEFFDTSHKAWAHASRFDQYQSHIPLVLHWPNKHSQTFTHLTSHYDIIPTLLTTGLGCKNPLRTYSAGHLLWDKSNRIVVLGSYTNEGLLTNDRILVLLQNGQLVLEDLTEKILENPDEKHALFEVLLQETHRFYKTASSF